MLKALLIALLAANLGLLAANAGWLERWTGDNQREPARLERQVNPELVNLKAVSAASAAALRAAVTASAAPSAPPMCLLTDPLDAAGQQLASAAARAAGVAESEWQRAPAAPLTRHLLVMGPFAEREQIDRKIAQVRRRNVPVSELQADAGLPAGVLPGLMIGAVAHDSEAAAEAALDALNKRGVRTARVIALNPVPRAVLRMPALDSARAAKLLEAPQSPWVACPVAGAASASAPAPALAPALAPAPAPRSASAPAVGASGAPRAPRAAGASAPSAASMPAPTASAQRR